MSQNYGTVIDNRQSSTYRTFKANFDVNGDHKSETESDEEREHLLQVSIPKSINNMKLDKREPSFFCDNKVTTSKYTVISFIPRYLPIKRIQL